MKRPQLTKKIHIYTCLIGAGIVLSTLLSCANKAIQASFDPTSDHAASADYQIGPDDVVEVLVWKNEALSRVVTVRPDGKISLPLIGDIPASGISAVQLQDDITEKLKEYYNEPPQVSVIIQKANSYAVYMSGEVLNPGRYTVNTGTTLLQAITLAGGLKPTAYPDKILVLRRENGNKESSLRLRYKDIISGNLENNILLRPGDTIVVL